MARKPIIALIYDFDGTLSPGNMQEFGFIQAIGQTPEEFWSKSDGIAKGQDASNILAYMKLMFDEARRNGIKLTREDFHRYGADIKLFEGVREWFRNVNDYGRRHGVIIEHYINSSGLKEIIEGTIIGKSVGVATVTLSFLSDGITYSDSVRVTVFDHYRMGAMTIVASDANNPATYEKETETIDGVVNSYRYHADVASWNNKLDVESTRHDQAADSYKRIVAGHIAYVSYAIRLSSGTTGRIACVAKRPERRRRIHLKREAGESPALFPQL